MDTKIYDLLYDNQDIKDLVQLFMTYQMADKAHEFSAFSIYVDQMEKRLDQVLNELSDVKQQLHDVQTSVEKNKVKAALSEMVEKLGDRLNEVKKRLISFKGQLTEKAHTLVTECKQKGLNGANHLVDFLGIKDTLMKFRDYLKEIVTDLHNSIDKINSVASEFREVGKHVFQIGTMVTGKETAAVKAYHKQGIFDVIQKPYHGAVRACKRGITAIDSALDNLDKLQVAAARKTREQKPSIMNKLEAMKGTQSGNEKMEPSVTKTVKKEASL
ncbi:hypothetical protein LJC58_01905 [Lachnospiraceae bacterium OttesenSCG-928-D06]|nr:hypothetical protein [Lachnospiraceae bacterium OttesenSCG-928-D06]